MLHVVSNQRLGTTLPGSYVNKNTASLVFCFKAKSHHQRSRKEEAFWAGRIPEGSYQNGQTPRRDYISDLLPQSLLCALHVPALQTEAAEKPLFKAQVKTK